MKGSVIFKSILIDSERRILKQNVYYYIKCKLHFFPVLTSAAIEMKGSVFFKSILIDSETNNFPRFFKKGEVEFLRN